MREFTVLCALLVVLHDGAAGVLWTDGGTVDAPAAATADPSADAGTLLSAAANNDETLRMTSDIRLSYLGNDTTVLRARTAAAPRRGRARFQAPVRRPAAPYRFDEAYVTPWGRWKRAGDDWSYAGGPDAHYEETSPRLFFPAPDAADRVETMTHGNGTTTVRLEGARTAPGPLSAAGENATFTYRIAFDDDRPYVAHATARPTGANGLAVTVDRRRGADVRRPGALPPTTPREIRDRLLAGAGV